MHSPLKRNVRPKLAETADDQRRNKNKQQQQYKQTNQQSSKQRFVRENDNLNDDNINQEDTCKQQDIRVSQTPTGAAPASVVGTNRCEAKSPHRVTSSTQILGENKQRQLQLEFNESFNEHLRQRQQQLQRQLSDRPTGDLSSSSSSSTAAVKTNSSLTDHTQTSSGNINKVETNLPTFMEATATANAAFKATNPFSANDNEQNISTTRSSILENVVANKSGKVDFSSLIADSSDGNDESPTSKIKQDEKIQLLATNNTSSSQDQQTNKQQQQQQQVSNDDHELQSSTNKQTKYANVSAGSYHYDYDHDPRIPPINSSGKFSKLLYECRKSRKLIIIIVATALLLDNMLLTSVVPIIPSYLTKLRIEQQLEQETNEKTLKTTNEQIDKTDQQQTLTREEIEKQIEAAVQRVKDRYSTSVFGPSVYKHNKHYKQANKKLDEEEEDNDDLEDGDDDVVGKQNDDSKQRKMQKSLTNKVKDQSRDGKRNNDDDINEKNDDDDDENVDRNQKNSLFNKKANKYDYEDIDDIKNDNLDDEVDSKTSEDDEDDEDNDMINSKSVSKLKSKDLSNNKQQTMKYDNKRKNNDDDNRSKIKENQAKQISSSRKEQISKAKNLKSYPKDDINEMISSSNSSIQTIASGKKNLKKDIMKGSKTVISHDSTRNDQDSSKKNNVVNDDDNDNDGNNNDDDDEDDNDDDDDDEKNNMSNKTIGNSKRVSGGIKRRYKRDTEEVKVMSKKEKKKKKDMQISKKEQQTESVGSKLKNLLPKFSNEKGGKLLIIDQQDLIDESFEVGVMFASKPIFQAIVNPFVGILTNKVGFTVPMFSGFVIMFISTLVFAAGQSYATLFAARCLQGIGSACTSVAGMAMLADTFPDDEERGRAMAIALGGLAMGVVIGPPFGGFMYEYVGKSSPFIALSLLALLDGLLQLFVLQPRIVQSTEKGASLKTLIKDPYILVAAGAITFANTGIAILEPALPLWMMGKMQASSWEQGVAFLPAAISYMLGTNFFGGFGHRIGRWLAAMIALVIIGLALLLIPFANNVEDLIIPNGAIGLAIGMVDSTMMPILGHLVDIRHTSVYGSVYAIGDIAFCASFAFGPALSGTLVELVGFEGLVIATACICFCYAPLLFFLRNPPARNLSIEPIPMSSSGKLCIKKQRTCEAATVRYLDYANVADDTSSCFCQNDEECTDDNQEEDEDDRKYSSSAQAKHLQQYIAQQKR